MSEFRVNSITNQDGSAGKFRYVVSQHLVESLVFRYQVDHQIFVDKMVVEEEEGICRWNNSIKFKFT